MDCRRSGIAVVVPHEIAVIYIKRDELSQPVTLLQSVNRGSCCGFFGQRAGTRMDNVRRPQKLRTDMLPGEQHIRAGLAGEGKAPVALLIQRDKGHGCGRFARQLTDALLDAVFLQGVHEKMAEIIVANHAAEGGFAALPGGRDGNVGRRAARFADVACFLAAREEVNDHFSDAKNFAHVRIPSADSFRT